MHKIILIHRNLQICPPVTGRQNPSARPTDHCHCPASLWPYHIIPYRTCNFRFLMPYSNHFFISWSIILIIITIIFYPSFSLYSLSLCSLFLSSSSSYISPPSISLLPFASSLLRSDQTPRSRFAIRSERFPGVVFFVSVLISFYFSIVAGVILRVFLVSPRLTSTFASRQFHRTFLLLFFRFRIISLCLVSVF